MPGAYPVVLSLTGIGQAMAAAAVAVAKHNFNPCAIINQGIAGGLVSEANVGDVIIGEYCINMNAFKTPFADRGEGSNSLKWKPKRSRGTGGGHEEISSAEDMSYVARKRILADAELLSLCRDTTGVGDKRQVLFGGVGTCETWNSEMDRIAYLHYIFGALCEGDMCAHFD